MDRLQKILAQAGLSSRRGAEKLIRQGRVTVAGQPARLGQKADRETDDIRLDGRPIRPAQPQAVYLFHKPQGVITTLSDPQGRPCLADYLTGLELRLFPVGRLDRDASGLLILTNDGRLAQRLSHPRHETAKTYLVQVRGRADAGALRKLAQGIVLGDRLTGPAQVELLQSQARRARLRLTIREGRNHQVKRMCRRVGLVVEELQRVAVGPLELGDLRPGQMRPLRPEESARLEKTLGRD